MLWRRSSKVWVVVVVAVVAWTVGCEGTQSPTLGDTPKSSDTARLQEIQRKFLDVVSNSTSSMRSMKELMSMLHSDAGQEMGRLLVEGFMLGVKQKDSGALLGRFWTELQQRLSPEMMGLLDDYRDFFAGMDVTTLPLIWEQIFKKDELGNSLAGLPLGQLVDMVQPTAARYGIDIRAFINSIIGKGDDNIRDLIIATLNNLDVSSLLKKFFNSTSDNAVQMKNTQHKVPADTHPKNGDKSKRGKDKTLRLFRPLVASLLRENEVDLDADAVLEVLSPLLSGDVLTQAAPLLATLGTQAGGGLAPIIANFLGGREGQQKQQQMGGLLGGLGALLAGGGGEKVDLGTMVNLASMFMDNSKPSKKDAKKNKKEKAKKKGIDMGSLLTLASTLAEKNNIDIGSVLGATNNLLNPGPKKKVNQPKVQMPKTEKQQPVKQTKTKSQPSPAESTRIPKPDTVPNTSKRSKNLIDVIEPVILSMQTDKACNRKIKDAILFGKAMLNKKISSLGDLEQLLPLLMSLFSGETMVTQGLDMDAILASMKQALAHGSWTDFLESLQNEDYRETLVRTVTPHTSELVTLLASREVQESLYNAAVPRIQTFLSSYGLSDVTLQNFPERMAPMVGLLAMGWDLPFKPTTVLVPLRDYLMSLRTWATEGLTHARDLSVPQVEGLVMTSLKEVLNSVVEVLEATRGSTVECLPQVLCHVNQGLRPNSLRAAVTRTFSLILASGPALEASDSRLLVKIMQAISGNINQCEDVFPGDCALVTTQDDNSDMMNLDYEHQEL
ncbi:uncharacterized protein [Panulirus ornatus]|uniref:uncharacterized protein n=1 Tax=Panulirus ornatus TaxID=150431 RepID=UPI003A867FA6